MDYQLAGSAISEMIDGVQMLQHLLFLAEQANVCKFDLDDLLVNYLGDVQLVADFKDYRDLILSAFQTVMQRIHRADPLAELYLIAHSEGAVITFLGILNALHGLPTPPADGIPNPADWVRQLKGLMTIGSPMNKHLLLWPELVAKFTAPTIFPTLAGKIRWRNYYDLGDPIGFRLDLTRDWLNDKAHPWGTFFEFDEKAGHDLGFTRYWFPGKAHNDYWTDAAVFRHFIDNVVLDANNRDDQKIIAELAALDKQKQPDASFPSKPPETLYGPKLISPVIPYLLAAGTLLAGVFLLYKGIAAFSPAFAEKAADSACNVLGIGLMLAGATAGVRIPRLIKRKRWRLIGIGVFLASWLSLPWFLTDAAKDRLEAPVGLILGPAGFDRHLLPTPTDAGFSAGVVRFAQAHRYDEVMMVILLGLILIAFAAVFWVGRYCPRMGVAPLIFVGSGLIVSLILPRFWVHDGLAVDDALDRLLAQARIEVLRQAGADADTLDASVVDAASIELVRQFTNNDLTPRQSPRDLYTAFQDFLKPTPPEKPAARHALEKRRSLHRRSESKRHVEPGNGKAESAAPPEESRSIWPGLLSCLAFLYLWWIAAILLDLSVVWQHYIRNSAILDRLAAIAGVSQENRAEQRSAT